MALAVKNDCERCGEALVDDELAFIGSWECTFCGPRTEQFGRRCPVWRRARAETTSQAVTLTGVFNLSNPPQY